MYKIGQTASLKKIFTEADVLAFSQLSMDTNPVHLDEEYAKTTIFGQQIVHGFLYSSLISAVIATKLPGSGSVYMSQSLRFTKPVFFGDEVEAIVTVMGFDEEKGNLQLETVCIKNGSIQVVTGEALIRILK
jgi:3-hydroxybutyryl-CoA dehydratase